ncbi:hypothetical protein [Acinetobacter kyonggiensis]|uniref:Uncharacterized protein n=1 Tax=Acinetobacter kyonggiensis TaxID=595670 RepID=A0A1H3L7S3_9GAMM|nr:hypothetical protein [Acinetobacter kyonggiensis]SDY60492.1 hypothetical protein SAMN05421643_11651 [Acinetobacter kyonggiensis]
MPDPNEQSKDQFCFELGQFAVEQPVEGKKKRTFTGIAYSGEPIVDHWYWERIIFDLDTIKIKGRIPALLEHRTSQRAGAINSHSVSHEEGLKIEGSLLSNEFGTQVAQDSDDGFPWQMSVRIEPSSTEEIAADQTVSVNGKTYQGPITVFRGGRIREVSFCALGADDNTNAVAASHSPKNFNQPEDTDVTELEKAQAEIAALKLKNTELETQNKQFSAAKREAEITALGKDLGKEFSAEDIAEMKTLDESTFAFSAKQLRQFSVTKPPEQKTPGTNPALAHLFSHQATGNQGGQQGQGGGQEHQFSAGAKAFAAQNKGA